MTPEADRLQVDAEAFADVDRRLPRTGRASGEFGVQPGPVLGAGLAGIGPVHVAGRGRVGVCSRSRVGRVARRRMRERRDARDRRGRDDGGCPGSRPGRRLVRAPMRGRQGRSLPVARAHRFGGRRGVGRLLVDRRVGRPARCGGFRSGARRHRPRRVLHRQPVRLGAPLGPLLRRRALVRRLPVTVLRGGRAFGLHRRQPLGDPQAQLLDRLVRRHRLLALARRRALAPPVDPLAGVGGIAVGPARRRVAGERRQAAGDQAGGQQGLAGKKALHRSTRPGGFFRKCRPPDGALEGGGLPSGRRFARLSAGPTEHRRPRAFTRPRRPMQPTCRCA